MSTAAIAEAKPPIESTLTQTEQAFVHDFPEGWPHLTRFRGLRPEHFAVVKIGGAILADEVLLDEAAKDLVFLQKLDLPTVVVYGGSDQIDEALREGSVPTRRADNGTRITEPKHLPYVAKGLDNAGSSLQRAIARAGGVSVRVNDQLTAELEDEANLGSATRADLPDGAASIIKEVLHAPYEGERGRIALINPLGHLATDRSFKININADLVAGAVGTKLGVDKLVILTEGGGINNDNGERIAKLNRDEAHRLMENGTITEGAIIKATAALEAGRNLKHVVIVSPRLWLPELFTDGGAGTEIS